MRSTKTATKYAAVFGAVVLLSLTTACGSDDESPSPAADPSSSMSEISPDMMASGETFGDGCADVPADGAGSFEGMASDPVATAASNNPALSTLVTAVGAADLGDTLNSSEDITVFAPANPAFEGIPKKDLNALLADTDALTSVLTYHVVAGELTPEDLAGTHKTLQGDTLEGHRKRRGLHRQWFRQRDLWERPDGQRHRLHHRRCLDADELDVLRESQVDPTVAGIKPPAGDDLAPGEEVNAFSAMGVGVTKE